MDEFMKHFHKMSPLWLRAQLMHSLMPTSAGKILLRKYLYQKKSSRRPVSPADDGFW